MRSYDDKRLDVVLLVAAALAVVLVAALAAWTAWLGGAWALVLAPFGLVLAVPLAVLASLRAAEDGDQWSQAPSATEQQPTPHATRTAA